MEKRVAVCGMGVISPVGNTVPEFWDSLVNGRNGISLIKDMDLQDLPVKVSADVKGFNPADYGAKSDILCYVSVPSKNIRLPVYNGASEENMSKGAVYLAKTSLPVGGNNTNCVIAAHNIFYGVKMFYRISELEPGDKIYITNYWETLEYEVISKEIAERNESRRLFIQPDKELLTLSTCYRPTRQINQRYIVCAQRVTEQNGK